jgi:glycosyltransferase involved in cell wall biosynthesis
MATDLVCVSRCTQKHLTDMFPDAVRDKPIAIVHPTVSDDRAPVRQTQPAEAVAIGKRGYFVAIASDDARKNLAELVRALPLLPCDVHLKVVGHFTNSRKAEFIAIDRRVEFLGYVSDAVKKETLAGSQGLIMPSLVEGFGIPLIEAACNGKPVFCSDIPVFHEVLGENAFYFDPRSPASIAQTIRGYLDEPAKYRARVAAAQAECLRRFSLQAMIDIVETYFGRRVGTDERTGSA